MEDMEVRLHRQSTILAITCGILLVLSLVIMVINWVRDFSPGFYIGAGMLMSTLVMAIVGYVTRVDGSRERH